MVIYMAGLGLTIMDVDSAQYASISQEMARTNEFLEVQNKGSDYLDKPPLLFWVGAVSHCPPPQQRQNASQRAAGAFKQQRP